MYIYTHTNTKDIYIHIYIYIIKQAYLSKYLCFILIFHQNILSEPYIYQYDFASVLLEKGTLEPNLQYIK